MCQLLRRFLPVVSLFTKFSSRRNMSLATIIILTFSLLIYTELYGHPPTLEETCIQYIYLENLNECSHVNQVKHSRKVSFY